MDDQSEGSIFSQHNGEAWVKTIVHGFQFFEHAPFSVFFQNFVANSVQIENDTCVYWTDLIKNTKKYRIPSKMEIAIRALYMEEYGAVALIIHI